MEAIHTLWGTIGGNVETKKPKVWIRFEEGRVPADRKTKVWYVMPTDGGDCIGRVLWYGSWRKYCFMPDSNCVFEQDCLRVIAEFIERATAEHKAARAT